MNVSYKKITKNEIPENAVEMTPSFHTVDNTPESLELFVSSKSNDETVYQFSVIPDETAGTYTDVMNDLTTHLFTKKVEGIDPNDENDVRRSVNIVTGEVAAKFDSEPIAAKMRNGSDGDDPRNKIFFHMVNGKVVASDLSTFNWDETINHLEDLARSAVNCKNLIHLMMTEKTVTPKSVDENGKEVDCETIPVEEFVERELNSFYSVSNLDKAVDYSVYDNDIATKREVLIARLIDVITINTEQILVASCFRAQRDIFEQLTKQSQPVTPEEKDAIEAEIENDEPEVIEAEELPAEE